MMRWLPVLVLLYATGAQAARTPFQARCEDTLAHTVTMLTTRQNGYTINNTLSYRDLTAMQPATRANSFVLGLTRTESMAAVNVDGRMLQDKVSSVECISPQISVSLYYRPIVIHVGREFRPGTCSYTEILAHEMRHLNVYLDHLPKVESMVRVALARRFEARPLYAPLGQAKSLLEHEIESQWLPYMKAEMAKVEPLHAAIDTAAEYARLSKVCKGEVQSLIGPMSRLSTQK
jgi:hypothetical protein